MKRTCLSIVGIILTVFTSIAQPTPRDSSEFKARKLRFEEANLVTSYYQQDGNHSAVTGGVGTEKLTDYSGALDVKVSMYDRLNRKHSFDFELGIDHYTSASSDKINFHTISSASYADTRFYPSLNWSRENEKKGSTIGAGISFSKEFDYFSMGANIQFSQKTKNRNGEFSAKIQAYIDRLKYITPIEFRPGSINNDEDDNYPSRSRNSFSSSFSWSQIVNQRFQMMFLADFIYQRGYLGLPFHRVYFTDNSLHIENLPASRWKIPLGIRANYFIGDLVILRGFYRFYHDDWDLNAHTAELESSIKVNSFFSVTPFYRYYKQSAARYFAPINVHSAVDEYYTSNYDLSEFTSQFYGAGFRIAPPKGLFGWKHFNMLELRYGHYTKNNGMHADIISLHLKLK
ncbi:MAG TPA: DUF3570 domain-containing protein [Chitinophagaceae bacterium]|nr:DUF3570 domain-containing protein [Chitinophagaceae bacterium]